MARKIRCVLVGGMHPHPPSVSAPELSCGKQNNSKEKLWVWGMSLRKPVKLNAALVLKL